MATQKSTKSLLEVFVQEMKIRNYSPKSISSYLGVLKAFIRYCHPKHPKDLTIDEIHGYLHHLIETKEVSRSTVDQTISSLKFLYNNLYNKGFSSKELPRPKKETKLPVVLSKKEIQAIIRSTSNFKYRTMIELMYGSGLRVSEVVKLKVQDFDLDRLTIMLHKAKGKKDRVTILSPKTVPNIKILSTYKSGSDYIFPSSRGGRLSERSLQKVFSRSVKNLESLN